MENSKYFQERFNQIEQAANNKSVRYAKDLEKKYKVAAGELDAQINKWYNRIAKNNNISMTEARRLLTASELKEFKWTVEEYIEFGRKNAIDQQWIKELENASAKFHINRLEAMKLECRHQIEKAMANGQQDMFDVLSSVYKDTFYRGCYEIQKGVGIGFDVSKLDDITVSRLLNKPWSPDGVNFSENIWKNKTKLINQLDQELTRMILTGDTPKRAIQNIKDAMNSSLHNAKRLVLTEQAYFTSEAQKKCFNDLDVERFEVLSGMDERVCPICAEKDKTVKLMTEFYVGVTAPPFHPFCRCVTAPYFDDEFTRDATRVAKGEDGETYRIPQNMSYNEWKATFVDGESKEGLAKDRFGIYTNNNKSNPKYYDFNNKDLYTVEKEISELDYEVGVIFDKNGKGVSCQLGASDEIRFTKHQLKLMKGGDITHNHPLSTPPSPEDLYLLVDNKANSFRTCGKNGAYVLQYSDAIKNLPSFDVFSNQYDNILEELQPKYINKVSNGMSQEDALIGLGEEIWDKLYDIYKIKPIFERR